MGKRGLLKRAALIFLSAVIFIGLFGCGQRISCSQIRSDRFVEKWNQSAQENPDGITKGKMAEKSGKNYTFYSPGITITQSSGYITALEYKTEDIASIPTVIEELFTLLPVDFGERGAQSAVNIYNETVRNYVPEYIEGIKLNFANVSAEEDVSYSLTVLYAYEDGIESAEGVPDGMYCFHVTLAECLDRYNELVREEFSDTMYSSGFDIIEQNMLIVAEDRDVLGSSVVEFFYVYRNGSRVTLWTDSTSRVCGIFLFVPDLLSATDALKADQINNRMWLWSNACVNFSLDKTTTNFGNLLNPGKTGYSYQNGICYIAADTEGGTVFGMIPSDESFFERAPDWFSCIPVS